MATKIRLKITHDEYPIANMVLVSTLDSYKIEYVLTPIKESDCFPLLDTPATIKLGISKSRKELADSLAKELSEKIVELLSSKDLFNGYSKEENNNNGKQY